MLAFLDRSNIGNAEIAGMQEDLRLEGDKYSWLLTIFYITYILFDFSLLLWKVFPPHRVAATVVLGWLVKLAFKSTEIDRSFGCDPKIQRIRKWRLT